MAPRSAKGVAGRIACVLCAVGALLLTAVASMDVYMIGFPDGHFTDYAKAAETPMRVLLWVPAGFIVVFLALAFSTITPRVRTVGLLAAVLVLGFVVLIQMIGIPWYFGTHLGLDNGYGG